MCNDYHSLEERGTGLLLREILFGLGCFLVMLVFFTRAHPIVVFDTDDWLYIYYSRSPFPDIKEWNPTRIFPELLMPLVGTLSASLLLPLAKNYVLALSWGFAGTVSLFIGVYCALFFHFVNKVCKIHGWKAICIGILFFLSHFAVFRVSQEGNDYLFQSVTPTCYFYYTIPALMNSSLVFYLLTRDVTENYFDGKDIARKAVFFPFAYLAIYSNLYESVILAVFCGVRMLRSVAILWKEKAGFFRWFRVNAMRILIVAAWIVSLGMEHAGARAKSVPLTTSLSEAVKLTTSLFWKRISDTNRVFIWIVIIIMAAFLIQRICSRKRKTKEQEDACIREIAWELLINGLIVSAFVVALCARTGPYRIIRPDVLLGAASYYFVLILMAAGSLLRKSKKSALALLPMVFALFFSLNTIGNTFSESNAYSLDPETCFAVTNDIFDQIVTADADNLQEIILDVPKSDDPSNWPFGLYAESRFSNALVEHGIIRRGIEVHMNPSEEFNRKYDLPW